MPQLLGYMGWNRDLPDFRDLSPEHDEINEILCQSQPLQNNAVMPPKIDLRQWCSPIENQLNLGSCTANAGIGIMEYFQKRTNNKFIDGSRLFVYKTTRNLMGMKGDTGADLRNTMKAMVLFGVPPEKYWPYNIQQFDTEPPAFCYSYAQNYQAIKYYRLDPPGTPTSKVLSEIKKHLAAGLPSMFGFTVYSSIPGIGDRVEGEKGKIPFPSQGDRQQGGHAVMAVGYDDDIQIGKDKGGLMIRNSWGNQWGENGYGWLPYSYVEAGLAVDFWSLVEAEFIDTELFK